MESKKKQVKHWFERRTEKGKKKRWFLDNGSIFLEELMADCNGKSVPIRSFSSDQIVKATNNFDSPCFVDDDMYYKWYRGRIEDRPYMIKIFSEHKVTDFKVDEVYNDIVLSARMSNHNNFLKLLGCCLEFPFPVLLFEHAQYGVLNSRGALTINGEESILPFGLRLKIAKEIANAVTYLHMAFPKIIIHRDIRPEHVFLDKNFTAKLSDFFHAISLEEGETEIEAELTGTPGYLDPLCYFTMFVTEYADVYSFGVFLFVVLTGITAIFTGSDGKDQFLVRYVGGFLEKEKLFEGMDRMIDSITYEQWLQVEECVMLALRCCEKRHEDRPKMIQVAKELKRIETSFNNSN